MGISFRHKGNFNKTERFLKKAEKTKFLEHLEYYGQMGVDALMSATPVDSGETAESWSYEISREADDFAIYWVNSNVNKGVNIALILQTGHGTRNGGYVEGRDYINPAIRPVFDRIANAAWRDLKNS